MARAVAEDHEQVWVKVNAPVDCGIASVVSALSKVDGLQTLQSCEGECGGPHAYVYFHYGDWEKIGALVFTKIGPALWERFGPDALVSVEVFNQSEPLAKLSFDKEATVEVASILENLFHERP
jgi:hypothetical protein